MDPDFIEWEGRIVGGAEAYLGQFPYQTSMRSAGNAHFCGGFIINTRWVGTAAHCTINRTPANTVTVVAAHHRSVGGTTYATARIINHENYTPATIANDISVVQTTEDIVFTIGVGPIAVGSETIFGGSARASGWGQTSHPGSGAVHLQYVDVDVMTNADCIARHSVANGNRIFDTTLCTTSPSGIGMCMGDSGGPLTQNNAVIGAVSWGIACAQGFPDQFVRISSFASWINNAISS